MLVEAFDSARIRAILLDVEGTTTPIDFVFKTLFPFASAYAEDFLRRNVRDPEVAEIIEQLLQTRRAETADQAPGCADTTSEERLSLAARYVRSLIESDSKITPLKTLQGKIWKEGFERGELKGEVYADVRPAFARWSEQGRRTAIFSSGSVLAQKLLFSHSTAGDLSPFLSAYFDTTSGPKREAEAYQKIAASIGLQAPAILFVSDVAEELDAASSTGMKTAHSLRPGISPLKDGRHRAVRTFNEIFPCDQ